MKLKGEYFKQIHDALMGAFNPSELRSMVRFELDLDLDELAGQNATKTEMAEALIRWAEDRDRVEKLIAAAREANPTNKSLEAAQKKLLSAGTDAYISGHETAPTTKDITAESYTDEKTSLEMIRIPEGNFIYGEEEWLDYFEYLPDYWISKTPVTNVQYFRFVKETGHDLPVHWEGKPPKLEIANHPVVNVNWHDAKAYADWADMDLPTEQEWEKAARGTDGRTYPWGNEWHDGYCNTFEAGIATTTPVGQYSPQGDSPYGCVDMAGNVWEWTASWFDDEEKNRVVRGGSWGFDQDFARAASRLNRVPHFRSDACGFRVVRNLPS
jgi:formylglycine-generating enzyme required for sulfatase activity